MRIGRFDQVTDKGEIEHLIQMTIEMGAWNQVLQRNYGNRRPRCALSFPS